MINKMFFNCAIAALIVLFLGTGAASAAFVIQEKGKTYIEDQYGEKWDVTQAMTLGFRPHGFQYGIGRDTIRPLDNSALSDDAADVPEDLRVIGVAEGKDAHGYSVWRLVRHEIANTTLGSLDIAAVY